MRGRRTGVLVTMLALAAGLGCSGEGDRAGGERGGAGQAGGSARPPVIRVTGIPTENPTELQRQYAPLVAYLEQKLGTKVTYVPVIDYGAAVQALSAGKVDFAWLGGFTHVQARVMADVVPLVQRDIDREFKSAFIAGAESGIRSPADLRGKSFAFGSKSSTSGHLMPRHFLLTEYQIDPDKDLAGKPVYSEAHDATVKIVESGKVQAGALDLQVWERMSGSGKVDLDRVVLVWTTPPYVDYVWTARVEVSEELRNRFRDAFLELDASNPEHRPILEIQGARKFVPAAPADFDTIEQVARRVGLLKS